MHWGRLVVPFSILLLLKAAPFRVGAHLSPFALSGTWRLALPSSKKLNALHPIHVRRDWLQLTDFHLSGSCWVWPHPLIIPGAVLSTISDCPRCLLLPSAPSMSEGREISRGCWEPAGLETSQPQSECVDCCCGYMCHGMDHGHCISSWSFPVFQHVPSHLYVCNSA